MRGKKSRRIVGGGIGDVGEGEKRGRKNEYGLVCLRSSYSVCLYSHCEALVFVVLAYDSSSEEEECSL